MQPEIGPTANTRAMKESIWSDGRVVADRCNWGVKRITCRSATFSRCLTQTDLAMKSGVRSCGTVIMLRYKTSTCTLCLLDF